MTPGIAKEQGRIRKVQEPYHQSRLGIFLMKRSFVEMCQFIEIKTFFFFLHRERPISNMFSIESNLGAGEMLWNC